MQKESIDFSNLKLFYEKALGILSTEPKYTSSFYEDHFLFKPDIISIEGAEKLFWEFVKENIPVVASKNISDISKFEKRITLVSERTMLVIIIMRCFSNDFSGYTEICTVMVDV
ncbi:MAG: hypothetical protein WCO65_01750 [bacterium]